MNYISDSWNSIFCNTDDFKWSTVWILWIPKITGKVLKNNKTHLVSLSYTHIHKTLPSRKYCHQKHRLKWTPCPSEASLCRRLNSKRPLPWGHAGPSAAPRDSLQLPVPPHTHFPSTNYQLAIHAAKVTYPSSTRPTLNVYTTHLTERPRTLNVTNLKLNSTGLLENQFPLPASGWSSPVTPVGKQWSPPWPHSPAALSPGRTKRHHLPTAVPSCPFLPSAPRPTLYYAPASALLILNGQNTTKLGFSQGFSAHVGSTFQMRKDSESPSSPR